MVLTGYFSDPDGDSLTYAAASSDEGNVAVGVSGDTLWVIPVGKEGATVTVTATDTEGLSAEQRFEVTILNRAPAPVDTIPSVETHVRDSLTIRLSGYFSDPDGDSLTYAATSSDEGNVAVGVSGDTLWVIPVGKEGATVTVTATDTEGLSAEQRFEVTILNRAPEPVGTMPAREMRLHTDLAFGVSGYFSDPDGDSLTFAATSSDVRIVTASISGAWMRMEGGGRGEATVTVTATDTEGLSAEQRFEVTILNRAPKPVGTIPAAEPEVGDIVTLEVSGYFFDPGDSLTYTAASSDEGVVTVSVSDDVLRMTGVRRGRAAVTVTATDTEGLSAEQTVLVSVATSQRGALVALYDSAGGPRWWRNDNWLTDAPLEDWYGVRTDKHGNVVSLFLERNNLIGRIPARIGDLTELRVLVIANSYGLDFGPIPPEIGELTSLEHLSLFGTGLTGDFSSLFVKLKNLKHLNLGRTRITGVLPPGIANLKALWYLNLSWTRILGAIPAEIGELSALDFLDLSYSGFSGAIPPRLGELSALRYLNLSYSGFSGNIPAELGELSALTHLRLGGNELTGVIPPELGGLSSLGFLHFGNNRLRGTIPAELGDLSQLRILQLTDNELSGALPVDLSGLEALEELHLAGNTALEGPLPLSLTALTDLRLIMADGTALCTPVDSDFRAWLEGIPNRRVKNCGEMPSAAYLIQSVQSRDYPVPLVAGKEALLRVFVTGSKATAQPIPPVRARFYLNGTESYTVAIPAGSMAVPTSIDESSLANSSNARIPPEVVQPGLQMVIEVDPEGTLKGELGVARRIPKEGRLALDVAIMPPFDLTVIPFLWEEDPDSAILEITERMAEQEEDYELFHPTYDALPIKDFNVSAHDPVETSTNSIFHLLPQVGAIRAMEGGSGYYQGLMSGEVTGGAGAAGTLNSFAKPQAWTIAHELGHNLSLGHAPCYNFYPDPSFPYSDGTIGVWGYDVRSGQLVPPTTYDFMSYCNPDWVSDYHFTNALRHRVISAQADNRPPAPQETILLWGGLTEKGETFLNPAFNVEALPTLPTSTGPYRLTGRDGAGDELFAFSFAMTEFTHEEGQAAWFVFALPVQAGWTGSLASITLAGPDDSVTLDQNTYEPMTIVRDARNGQVRGFLSGMGMPAPNRPGSVFLQSPGIPRKK